MTVWLLLIAWWLVLAFFACAISRAAGNGDLRIEKTRDHEDIRRPGGGWHVP